MKTWDKLLQTKATLNMLQAMAGWKLTKKAPKHAKVNLRRALRAAENDLWRYRQRLQEEGAAEELSHTPVLEATPMEDRHV